MEKFIPKAKHIEVQVFGDGKGNVIHLGERECSIQRRNQKLIEESPSLALTQELRDEVCGLAVRLCQARDYQSAGTVEFLFDKVEKKFYFLEVNTRLQVEHRVTELRYGIDLVEWMIRQASEETAIDLKTVSMSMQPQGHAVECRINAENPLNNFKPTTGALTEVSLPNPDSNHGRVCLVDTWVQYGSVVSSNYDSLLMNVICWAATRQEATKDMLDALHCTTIGGPPTNLAYFREFLNTDAFVQGEIYSDVLVPFAYRAKCIEVITPGLLTTVQDWPGRQDRGLWRIGVPPSGPMDHLASRIANSLVDNEETTAVIEITQQGPTLKFHCDGLIAITGAAMKITLTEQPINMWQKISVKVGNILKIGNLTNDLGSRAYLAISGGFDVPKYLGSRSTFPNGNLGGYQGRALRVSDVIPIGKSEHSNAKECPNEYHLDTTDAQVRESQPSTKVCPALGKSQCSPGFPGSTNNKEGSQADKPNSDFHGDANLFLEKNRPFDPSPVTSQYRTNWQIGVLPGPHANPEYFTDEDMEMFYNTKWKVHYNSNRMGIRLLGPAPKWARSDGGEGGSHPSNIHDCEYGIGTINFTGNMPIIIAQDGPSLGGFVCPCTIVQSELWKIGQVKAGDTIEFWKMTIAEAIRARRRQNECIRNLTWSSINSMATSSAEIYPETKSVLCTIPKTNTRPKAEIRLAGDSYILVEYGPMTLDLNLRFRIHFLEQVLQKRCIFGLEETAPGVRSLQIRYNPLILPLSKLLEIVTKADGELQDVFQRSIPTRILHLPMCFDNSSLNEAIEKYMKSMRAHAPYLPSNIDYISRNNGLPGVHEVREKVFSASYMCVGLGDVYLGACCAVPINPLHRLVTSKYNPARTYTQEGTVGLGGSYMCIYPMNSPGGYQLVGRTLPIWDTFAITNRKLFSREKPWLLQMFDQIRFFPVSESELEEMRAKFKCGELELHVEKDVFDIAEYNRFVNKCFCGYICIEIVYLMGLRHFVFFRSVNMMINETEIYRQAQMEAANVLLKEEQKSLKKLETSKEGNLSESCFHKPQVNSFVNGSVKLSSPLTGKVVDVCHALSSRLVLRK